MPVQIDTTPFSNVIKKKSIGVEPTGAVFDKAQDIQIELIDGDIKPNETFLEFKKRDRKTAKDVKEFIKKALTLTTKQWDKINETIDNDVLMKFGMYMALALQGAEYKSYQEYVDFITQQAEEDADTDPKSLNTDEEN
jgi:hypothetical protein